MAFDKNTKKGFAKNLILNVSAMVIMNLVIQFVVYPLINRDLGQETYGRVLYLMAIIAVVAGSFGSALNNTRLANKPKYESTNGDYNSLLLLFAGISAVVSVVIIILLGQASATEIILFAVLMLLTLCRFFFDVAFRLTLNYTKLFIYYMCLSAGYLIGSLLFSFSKIWYIALIIGEASCIVYTFIKGRNIFTSFLKTSDNRSRVWKDVWFVALSYLISNFFLSVDRILLNNTLGGAAVTTYYTASLLGKTLALLVVPLTGVLISYLANYQGIIHRKTYLKVVGGVTVLSAVVFAACVFVSPWLIRILYPNLYDSAAGMISIGTLGQILYFASTLLLAILLRFCKAKYQFIIQGIYGAIYLALAIPAAINYGIFGFAYATIISNGILFIIVVSIGLYKFGKGVKLETE